MVDHMFEAADFAPAAQRERLQADVVCYLRAVQTWEWPAMAHGGGSKVPSNWTTDFRAGLQAMNDSPALGMLVSADKDRSQARQTRIAEASPTIPNTVYFLMLAALAVLVVTLLVIRDVDRPFSGVVQIKPSAIAAVEDDVTEDFIATYGKGRLPCDDQGRPRRTAV
jgi:hypothetical protein